MIRLTTWSSAPACTGALTALFAMAAATSARGDEAPSLPAEVQQIQRALGGPAVDQYQELRPVTRPADERWVGRRHNVVAADGAPLRTHPSPPDRRTAAQAGALREAAAQLDGSANRLETLELYHQADAMRTLAQRLRLGAREMVGGPQGAGERPGSAPSSWSQPPAILAPTPTPAAQPAPAIEPTPADAN